MATIKKCDRLFQQLSNGKQCIYCGKPAECSHHVIRRSRKLTRWLPDNGQPVCLTDHQKIHDGLIKEKPVPDRVKKLAQMDYKNFLMINRMSEKEFMKYIEYKLKGMIDETI